MLRYPIRRLVWGLVAWGLAACDSSRQVDVEMTLQRGSCASPECGEVIRGTGLLFASAGRELGSEPGEPTLYSEAVTGAGTTILLEVAFRGSIVDEVRFREVERSRVLYRGRILRRSFRPTTDGWAFALDTVDARAQGANGPPPIVVRNGTIVRRASADAEQVARDHADTDIEGGCGGSVVDTIAILPDPEDAEFDDPTLEDSDFEDGDFEDADVEDPSPTDPPEDIQDPPPPTGEPPPPDDMDDDPPPGFFDSDGGGCSGDTADDDSGGCDTDDEPDDEGGGCSGDEAPDDHDGGGGCGGDDDGADSDEGGGCGGDDDSESDDGGGCEGDDDDGGCSGSSGSMSAVFTGRAVRGTFRLAWPVGLVAWVNRRMRRRCG